MSGAIAIALVALLLTGSPSWAEEVGERVDGGALDLVSVVPFVGLLLSIAILPITAPRLWHHHYGKITIGWAALAIVPIVTDFGLPVAANELLHVAVHDYVPFIILLTTLYVVAGGIRVSGRLIGTPGVNTFMLALGTLLAGFMGTTGASMLLVRPILSANERRRYKVHTFVFLIFLVSNIGGAMSPLGDPPLFLGFLRGVEFFWPTIHLALPTAMVTMVLLALFYSVDSTLYRREVAIGRSCPFPPTNNRRIVIEGSENFVLLGCVLLAVMASASIDVVGRVNLLGIALDGDSLIRDFVLLAVCGLSLWLTAPAVRAGNNFTWAPIAEVARLFAGIFVTIIAPLAILSAGHNGALGGVMAHLMDQGRPIDAMFFWVTGVLSSFLDNAPTYLVFFNVAGGDAIQLMGPLATTLAAISAGAVYMGAMTYIGNAPNLMVKSIVESHGVRMPSFFGYMGWSIGILLPVFAVTTLVFFR
jgi:Na+/H+ antiporter NhaD/arsenite permease-like protein